ncbi:hypothetical protein ABZ921_38430 [Streptomyces atriruber]|uniref:Uncharacterized protein n=1 Tax=Streptomyces atriruber TaxID=545121 RepID=A0ABV3C1M5_9ACTN
MTERTPATYGPGDVANHRSRCVSTHPARDFAHHPSKEHTP